MNERLDRFAGLVARLDEMHRADPRALSRDGAPVPWSVLYHARLAWWVERLEPGASEALRIAARCQHVKRWTVERSAFPTGLGGYKRWRSTAARMHAGEAERAMREEGYDDPTILRVRALLIKKGLGVDAEVQILEDAICLTFLENELADFAAKHEDDKVLDILRKTWRKMSPRGHAAALALAADLPARARALVAKALGPTA